MKKVIIVLMFIGIAFMFGSNNQTKAIVNLKKPPVFYIWDCNTPNCSGHGTCICGAGYCAYICDVCGGWLTSSEWEVRNCY
jgi:hypothetical protein